VDRNLAVRPGVKQRNDNPKPLEEKNMNARINEATIPGLVKSDEAGEATNRARYAMLNELPGVVFGFLTLAWIVTSLFGLV
jgi:hypothetical protein